MSIVSGVMQALQGRVFHVPNGDMRDVLETANQLKDPQAPAITERDWRLFEHVQAMYTAGRVLHQATPRTLQPIVDAAENFSSPLGAASLMTPPPAAPSLQPQPQAKE